MGKAFLTTIENKQEVPRGAGPVGKVHKQEPLKSGDRGEDQFTP